MMNEHDNDSYTVKFDALVFVIEAMATNARIEKDIAKLYKENKYEAYRLAKNSEMYNEHIFRSGSIKKEVDCKRILGLFLLGDVDDKIDEKLIFLMEKGWREVSIFLKKKDKFSFMEIWKRFIVRSQLTAAEVNNLMIISFKLSDLYNLEIIKDKYYEDVIIRGYFARWVSFDKERRKKYKDINTEAVFIYEEIPYDVKEKAKNIEKRFFKEYKKLEKIEDIFFIKDTELTKYLESLMMIYDIVNIDFTGIADSPLKRNEIRELAAIYFLNNNNQNKEDSAKFIIEGLILKKTLKAFRDVKEYYFKNNKETLFLELESAEKKIDFYKRESKILRKENERLFREVKRLRSDYKDNIERENLELKREIEKLKNSIDDNKNIKREQDDLKKMLFHSDLDNVNRSTRIFDSNFDKIKPVNAIIVGGYEKWQQKLRQKLPETFDFISVDNKTFDVSILKNQDYVFYYTDYLNHALYEKTIQYCRKNSIVVEYLKNTSIERVLSEIYEKIEE